MSPRAAAVVDHEAIASETGHFSPRLALTELLPSPTNPRKHFDPAYLDELAGSIKQNGLLQAIVVRPLNGTHTGPETFEIVLGECRYRAAKQAGLDSIAAVVRNLADDEVRELQLIENLHRKDLTPMEEARAYRGLIDANPTKHSAEWIATKIGMSVAYVWDRLKLNDLIPDAKKILEDERITVGHAILIARQTPENQRRIIEPDHDNRFGTRLTGLWTDDQATLAFEDRPARKIDKYAGLKPVSVRELEKWITEHIRFDVEHAAKAQPLTFEETAVLIETAASKPGRGKKVIAITHEYRVADDARDDKERTYGSQSWRRADGQEKSKTCDASVLGVFVAGDDYGTTLRVCVARDRCQVHFGKEIKEREKNAKLRASGKAGSAAKRENAQADREQREERERQLKETRWKTFLPALTKAVNAATAKTPATLPTAVYKEVLRYHRLPPTTTPAQLQKALLQDAIKSLFGRQYVWLGDEPKLVAWAKLLGVDVKACEPKEAVETSGVATTAKAAKKTGKSASA